MDDVIFTAQLFSAKLLPGNVKDQVKSQATCANKATYFLDHVIKPSLTSGVGSSFNKLLKVMDDSEYDDVKELSKQIRSRLGDSPADTLKTGELIVKCIIRIFHCGLHSATIQCTSGPLTAKSSPIDVELLQTRYLRQPPTSKTDWPMHHVTQYVRLALVEKEDVTTRDENLNEITKLSLQGEVDKILKKKLPLDDLKDIFNKPCPRLILIMGAPGEYYKVLVVVM